MKTSKLFLMACIIALVGVLSITLVACDKGDEGSASIVKTIKGTTAFSIDGIADKPVRELPTAIDDITMPSTLTKESTTYIQTTDNRYYIDVTNPANDENKQHVIYDLMAGTSYGEFNTFVERTALHISGGYSIYFVQVTNSEGKKALVDINGNLVVDYTEFSDPGQRLYAHDIICNGSYNNDAEFGDYTLIEYADGKTYMVNIKTYERQEYVAQADTAATVGTVFQNRWYEEECQYYCSVDEIKQAYCFYDSATAATPTAIIPKENENAPAANIVVAFLPQKVLYKAYNENAAANYDYYYDYSYVYCRYYIMDLATGETKQVFENMALESVNAFSSKGKTYLSFLARYAENKVLRSSPYYYVASDDGTLLVNTVANMDPSYVTKLGDTNYLYNRTIAAYILDNCFNYVTSFDIDYSINMKNANFYLANKKATALDTTYTEIGFNGKVLGSLTLKNTDQIIALYGDYVLVSTSYGYASYKTGSTTETVLYNQSTDGSFTFEYIGKGICVKYLAAGDNSVFIDLEGNAIKDCNGYRYSDATQLDDMFIVEFDSSNMIYRF